MSIFDAGKVRPRGERISHKSYMIGSNPCSEIIFPDSASMKAFAKEYSAIFNGEKMTKPHCQQVEHLRGRDGNGRMRIQGNCISALLEFDDFHGTLTFDVPGVNPERITVRRIEDTIRVHIAPEGEPELDIVNQQYSDSKYLEYIMDGTEVLEEVTLERGQLILFFVRNLELEDFPVNEVCPQD